MKEFESSGGQGWGCAAGRAQDRDSPWICIEALMAMVMQKTTSAASAAASSMERSGPWRKEEPKHIAVRVGEDWMWSIKRLSPEEGAESSSRRRRSA